MKYFQPLTLAFGQKMNILYFPLQAIFLIFPDFLPEWDQKWAKILTTCPNDMGLDPMNQGVSWHFFFALIPLLQNVKDQVITLLHQKLIN